MGFSMRICLGTFNKRSHVINLEKEIFYFSIESGDIDHVSLQHRYAILPHPLYYTSIVTQSAQHGLRYLRRHR